MACMNVTNHIWRQFGPLVPGKFTAYFDAKKLKLRSVCVSVFLLLALGANAVPINIDLGTAGNFALLAGSTITNAHAGTFITGDVGVSPGSAVTGLLPVTNVAGNLYLAANATTGQAQTDLTGAYNTAADPSLTRTSLTGQDLGGLSPTPGVYFFSSSAGLTGILTLDAQGDPNAQWVFQIGSTLDTATNAKVDLINGADACKVFWQVGSSATLQTGTDFAGTILALTSITLNGGTLDGRALARNGAVTITGQQIVDNSCPVVPEPATLTLIGLGVGVAGLIRRRRTSK